MFTLILGGAGSGKSKPAQRIATPAGRVVYIATAATSSSFPTNSVLELFRKWLSRGRFAMSMEF
jgi:hypothetical protein